MADLIYRYDGTFDGLLCCVFQSFTRRETPAAIFSVEEGQASLYPERWIETVPAHAARVYASLSQKISQDACDFVRRAFLTCLAEKELYIYRFIREGYRLGAGIMNDLTRDTVHVLNKAVRHLENEAHQLIQFVRFSQYGTALVSIIHPKNTVLPLMAEHFCARYPNETFAIYDEPHHMLLSYHPYEAEFLHVDSFTPPKADGEEELYRALWRQFFETIAVEGRINPRCQMTHMPKRYWRDMTETAPKLFSREDPGRGITAGSGLGEKQAAVDWVGDGAKTKAIDKRAGI